ncbi:hypothetical protein UFOVP77_38 [uncultured Caudovirales phage]|uniref:Uncharacterized protein n=1 Tax=uncultured Caudovirales phage TaxID=2100421 RepID=A0A6J5L364_9CAUD|nr:hypothetical protein UFOVP77_38 [uncultured Caudovirales phage]
MNYEDEEFNRIEMESRIRKEAVLQALHNENERLGLYKDAYPEQKPVAYINIEERKLEWAYKYMSWDTPTVINLPKIPLYTEPPQRTWVGLTDEEITTTSKETHFEPKPVTAFARAIETKLKEKNT